MSKGKNKKRNASNNKTVSKKRISRKKLIVALAAVAASVTATIIAVVIFSSGNKITDELVSSAWAPSKAQNSSGDEVELAQVYNTEYTTYQGSLSFTDEGRFSLWMSPGDASDGSRTGTYTVENEIIKAVFDNGTQSEFRINSDENNIISISVYYDDYEVLFSKQ